MNLIIHMPTKEVHKNELKEMISNIYSNKIIGYLNKSNLSYYDKNRMIDMMIKNKS